MAEYIDRQAANNALRECVRAYPNSFYNGIEVARSAIIKIPAADVRPVVRGEWIARPYMMGNTQYCSRCGENYGVKHNFCPNCGAMMEES